MSEERYTSPPGWVAEQLGVGRSTVERWAKAGQIPAVVIGGRVLVHWKELKRRIDDEAGAHHDRALQNASNDGEATCRTKGKAVPTGGLISRVRRAKELDNLLGHATSKKRKRSKAG